VGGTGWKKQLEGIGQGRNQGRLRMGTQGQRSKSKQTRKGKKVDQSTNEVTDRPRIHTTCATSVLFFPLFLLFFSGHAFFCFRNLNPHDPNQSNRWVRSLPDSREARKESRRARKQSVSLSSSSSSKRRVVCVMHSSSRSFFQDHEAFRGTITWDNSAASICMSMCESWDSKSFSQLRSL